MDDLDKKAQKGLESFSEKGDLKSLKGSLDSMVDDLLNEDSGAAPSQEEGKSNLKWLYILLAILGLLLVGYFGFMDAQKGAEVKASEAVYAQYFEVLPDALSASERGDTEEVGLVSDADQAMMSYNKGDFKQAATILTQQDEVGYVVFGSIAALKNNEDKKALTYLLKSKKMDGAEQYNDIIDWYLSLAYLKQGDIDKAKSNLAAIAKSGHYKQKEAKEILKSFE